MWVRGKEKYLLDIGDEFGQGGIDQLLLGLGDVTQRQDLGNAG